MTPESTTVRPVRVYLLNDHDAVRRELRGLLEDDGRIEVIGESGHAVDAARRITSLRPDVAVVDSRLPDGSGIDVCRDIRSVDPTIDCLILVSYEEETALLDALMEGAAAYVLRQIRPTALIDAIHSVARKSLFEGAEPND